MAGGKRARVRDCPAWLHLCTPCTSSNYLSKFLVYRPAKCENRPPQATGEPLQMNVNCSQAAAFSSGYLFVWGVGAWSDIQLSPDIVLSKRGTDLVWEIGESARNKTESLEFGEVVKHESCLAQPKRWHHLPFALNFVTYILCNTLISHTISKRPRKWMVLALRRIELPYQEAHFLLKIGRYRRGGSVSQNENSPAQALDCEEKDQPSFQEPATTLFNPYQVDLRSAWGESWGWNKSWKLLALHCKECQTWTMLNAPSAWSFGREAVWAKVFDEWGGLVDTSELTHQTLTQLHDSYWRAYLCPVINGMIYLLRRGSALLSTLIEIKCVKSKRKHVTVGDQASQKESSWSCLPGAQIWKLD